VTNPTARRTAAIRNNHPRKINYHSSQGTAL
jgi:hypothetical protein